MASGITPRVVGGEIVDRRTMTLFQYASIGGKVQYLPFEKDVVWVASSETRLEFWHGEQLLKEDATFNDFYGYLTSMQFDSGMQHRVAEMFKVGQESTLEIRLTTDIFLEPFEENSECHEWNKHALARKVKYKFIDLNSEYRLPHKRDYGDGLRDYYEVVQPLKAVQEVTWRSSLPPDENNNLFSSFQAKWGNIESCRNHFVHCINESLASCSADER